MLVSGILSEVVLVRPFEHGKSEAKAFQIRIGQSAPGACPKERMRFVHYSLRKQFSIEGICPIIRETEIPSEGVFIVSESFRAQSSEAASYFQPRFLMKKPPGPLIRYRGIEIQERRSGKISVLASSRSYLAPGLLAPILIGCWGRPDNIIWTLPAGDTGCGFWRLFVGGGTKEFGNTEWIFWEAFGPSKKRRQKAPSRQPVRTTPLQVVKILEELNISTDDIALHLPKFRETLLNPDLPDKAIIDLIIKRASQRHGKLEGALIALLMDHRPAAALLVPKLIEKIPEYIVRPERVIFRMKKNEQFRRFFTPLMFASLSGIWTPHNPSSEHSFIQFLSEKEPDFLCQNLDRITNKGGILDRYTQITLGTRLPIVLPTIIEETLKVCNSKGINFIKKLFRRTRGVNRERMIDMIEHLETGVLKQLQGEVANGLLVSIPMDKYPYRTPSRRRFYVNAHLILLRKTGLECKDILKTLASDILKVQSSGQKVPKDLIERSDFIRDTSTNKLSACR